MSQFKIEICPHCKVEFHAEPGKYFYDEKKDISFCKEECFVLKNTKTPRRSKEEIAQAKAAQVQEKADKEQAKAAQVQAKADKDKDQAKAALAQAKAVQLMAGLLPDARAAMKIFEHIRLNGNINHAFRRMLMMRKLFNPRENINKFMTGGGAEEVVHQLILSVGFDCQNVSAKATVIDLEIKVPLGPTDVMPEVIHCFKPSLKNSGKISATPILENYRGKKRDDIRPLPPTFIIYTEVDAKRVRIVYLDHEIIRRGFPTLNDEEFAQVVFKNEDSNLTFKSGFLPHFIPRLPNEYILTADYPEDLPVVPEQNIILLALAEVDRHLAIHDAKK